jgi:cytochrome b involved in lipid metabolism
MLKWFEFAASLPEPVALKTFTWEEVALHRAEKDCWIVLEGRVYNLTPFLSFHPAGIPVLKAFFGRDATMAFRKAHAWICHEKMLSKCLLGFIIA